MRLAALVVSVALVFPVDSGLSQTAIYRSVAAAAGRPVQIAAHSVVRRDCSHAAAPEIRVVVSPRNGTLLVKAGTAKPGQIKQCPNLAAPLNVLVYQANAGFGGQDVVSYDLVKEKGAPERHSVTINVSRGAPARPRPPATIDL
jgi:hypothetical protein